MIRLIACVITIVSLSMAFSASAVLTASESFEYSDGSIDGKNGGTGFSSAWVGGSTSNQVASPGASAIALPTAGGKLELGSGASTYATRSANFTDFHFNIDATNYVSVILNKGGTVEGGSGEYLDFDIRALSSGIIAGITFGSHETVKLKLRNDGVEGTEKLDLDTDYLFLMKVISSTTGNEQAFLTWYKAGDAIPANEALVNWKLSLAIPNNAISASDGLRARTGSIFADVDEFKLGSEFSNVIIGSAFSVAAESFDYSAGSIDGGNGGDGFSGAWIQGSAANQVVSPGSPAISLPTAGNKLELGSGTSAYATRSASFPDFHFHTDATNYVSVIMSKGGTTNTSSEYLEFDIAASSGRIVGIVFGSNEKAGLKLRNESTVWSTETLDLDTDYLFLLKLITTTSSGDDEQAFLTWYKVGDGIPEDEASVDWKVTSIMGNNTIGSNNGVRARTGSNATGYVDEFKLDPEYSRVVEGVEQILFASVEGWVFTNNLMGMEVNVAGNPSAYRPQARTSLGSGSSWADVPHSDNGTNAFIITNLNYSTAYGSNQVIFLTAPNATEFFRIIGE